MARILAFSFCLSLMLCANLPTKAYEHINENGDVANGQSTLNKLKEDLPNRHVLDSSIMGSSYTNMNDGDNGRATPPVAIMSVVVDPTTLVKGTFDVESSQQFSTLLGEVSSKSLSSSDKKEDAATFISLSFSLPGVTSDDTSDRSSSDMDGIFTYMFDCKQGNSNVDSPTSFFICQDATFNSRYRNRGHTLQASAEIGSPKAYLGVDGSFITGVIDAGLVGYEIISRIVRDEVSGDMTDVLFEYTGLMKKVLSYQSIEMKEQSTKEDTNLTVEYASTGDDGSRNRSLLRPKEDDATDINIHPKGKMVRLSIEEHRERISRGLIENGSEIDLLIYFTKRGACDWLDEPYPCILDTAATALLESYSETWVQYFNEIVADSAIDDLTYVKVGMAIDPTYDEGFDPDLGHMHEAMRITDDGKMDEAHLLRDEYNADLIVTFTTGGGGVAPTNWINPIPSWGFSVSAGT